MSIRAVFPSGWSEITVHGLHQWDYGQTLEIQADDLPAIVEVHFACQGMKDAPVRVCNAVSGVATAAIPDICLEQSTTVTAWICEVGATSGRTIKTVSLPIIARARPQSVETVPAEGFSDQYTEALAAFNAAADTLKTGTVTVARAVNAGHAGEASHADEATHADAAGASDVLAPQWVALNNGGSVSVPVGERTQIGTCDLEADAVYLFRIQDAKKNCSTTVLLSTGSAVRAESTRGMITMTHENLGSPHSVDAWLSYNSWIFRDKKLFINLYWHETTPQTVPSNFEFTVSYVRIA